MTLFEMAWTGLLVTALSVTLLSLRGLVDGAWGLVLLLTGLVYAARAESLTSRHWTALVLLALWAVGYSLSWRRRKRIAGSASTSTRTRILRRMLGATFEIFLASAPILIVLSDPHDAAWSWSESLGLLVAAIGFALVRVGQLGYSVAFAALYILALGSPSGVLTLFSVLIVARHCRQSLQLPDSMWAKEHTCESPSVEGEAQMPQRSP